jgi:hypothetical protein
MLLPSGTIAPYDGILTSQKNYRLFSECVDSSDASEKAYDSEKSKDFWKNLSMGFLLGAVAGLLVKH